MGVELPPNPKLVAVALRRNDLFAENYWQASGAIVKPTGQVVQQFGGNPQDNFVKARATLQPLEVGMLFKTMKILKKEGFVVPNLTGADLAVLASNNQGEEAQTKRLLHLMKRFYILPNHLVCGSSKPATPLTRLPWENRSFSSSLIFHPSLPHHVALVLLSKLIDAEPQHYWQPTGKLQQALLHSFQRSADPLPKARTQPSDTLPVRTDTKPLYKMGMVRYDQGFIPTFTMSLQTLGTLFAHLVSDKGFEPLLNALKDNPHLVGNRENFDAQLLEITQGNLIPKSSKGNLICIANRKTQEAMVLKLWSGQGDTGDNVRDRVALKALQQAGWLSEAEARKVYIPTIPMLEKIHPKDSQPLGTLAIEKHLWQPPATDVASNMLVTPEIEAPLDITLDLVSKVSNLSGFLEEPVLENASAPSENTTNLATQVSCSESQQERTLKRPNPFALS
jgi:L-asparaginase II